MPKPKREQLEEYGGVQVDSWEDFATWERSLWRSFPSKAEYDTNENDRYVMPLNGPLSDIGLPIRKEGAAHSTSGSTVYADCDTYRTRGGSQSRYRFGHTGKRWQKKLSGKHYRPYYKSVGGQLVEITEGEAIEAVGAFPEICYADYSEGQLSKVWEAARRYAERITDHLPRSKDMYGSGAYTERYTDSRGKLSKPRGQYEAERYQRVPETRADVAEDLQREGKDPHDPSYGEWQDAGLTKDRQLAGNELDKDAFDTTVDYTAPSVEDQAEELENERVWEHLKETGDYDPRRIQDDPPAKDRDND